MNSIKVRFTLELYNPLKLIILIILPPVSGQALRPIRRERNLRENKINLWNNKDSKKRIEFTAATFQELLQRLPWNPMDLFQQSEKIPRNIFFEPLWNYAIRKSGTDNFFESILFGKMSVNNQDTYSNHRIKLLAIDPTLSNSNQRIFSTALEINADNIVDRSILPLYSTKYKRNAPKNPIQFPVPDTALKVLESISHLACGFIGDKCSFLFYLGTLRDQHSKLKSLNLRYRFGPYNSRQL